MSRTPKVEDYSKIIGIIGDKGGGKTAFMTHKIYEDYAKFGTPIKANYTLNFLDKKKDDYLRSLKMVSKLQQDLTNSIIALDEIHEGADSRRALSETNMSFSKLATQLRKRNCILFYTTQRLGQIDKRLRTHTDYIVMTEKMKDKEKNIIPNHFHVVIIENHTGDILSEFVWDATEFFKMQLYDTMEIIDFESLEEKHERYLIEEEKKKLNSNKRKSKGGASDE